MKLLLIHYIILPIDTFPVFFTGDLFYLPAVHMNDL